MKFREYGEVKPITISSNSEEGLDKKIAEIGEKQDIIDLQFACAYDNIFKEFTYSALLLVKESRNVLH